MLIKTFTLLFLLVSMTAVIADDQFDCQKVKLLGEDELVHALLKPKTMVPVEACFHLDEDRQDVVKVFSMVYVMVEEMNGLPADFIKKWHKLTRDLAKFVVVDHELCLGDNSQGCTEESQLVAKNFKKRKQGAILVNRTQWRTLDLAAKASLLWHEVLGVMGYEVNSYAFSSMVKFSTKCETISDSHSFSSNCYIVVTLLDPSFIKRH
jgi:hypothetical protein